MIKNPTICIITYKREDGLFKLLSELEKQTFTNFNIIVTDNASESKVEDVVKKSNLNISLFKETNQGISYARNKCIAEFLKTDSDALVWIDDDEWPETPEWLENLIEASIKHDADIVTGDVLSLPEDDSKQFLCKALYAKPMGNKTGDKVRYFYTNNTLLKRKVIETVGALDLFYNQTGSGDLDYAIRSNKNGYKAIYCKKSRVIELHPSSRSTLKWFAIRGFRVGQGSTLVNVRQYGFNKVILKLPLYIGYRFLDGCIILLKSLVKKDKGLAYAGVLRVMSSFGTLSGIFGFKYREYKKK